MAGPGGWGLRRGGFSAGVAWPGEPLPRPPQGPGPGRPPRPALPSAGSVAPPRRASGGPEPGEPRAREGGGGGGAAPRCRCWPPPAGRAALAALPAPSAPPQHLPGAGGRPGAGRAEDAPAGGRAEPSAPHSWIPHSNFKSRLLLPPPPMGARSRPLRVSPLAVVAVRPGSTAGRAGTVPRAGRGAPGGGSGPVTPCRGGRGGGGEGRPAAPSAGDRAAGKPCAAFGRDSPRWDPLQHRERGKPVNGEGGGWEK